MNRMCKNMKSSRMISITVLMIVIVSWSRSVRCQSNLIFDEFISQQSILSKKIDNHKPAFVNCKGYAPILKEEQPYGVDVIQVKAVDPDPGQEIEYSFVKSTSERLRFRINSKTGMISTAYSFDRDEPIREKDRYVTVRATDNGRPPLDDVCTFKVTIEDINDNPPVFDKSKYEESVAKDTQIGKVVMRISASDLDDSQNSIVKYEFLPEKDYHYFAIDENNGLITLNKTIDRDPGKFFDMTVRAYNIVPDMPQDAQTNVRLRVIESNKKPPTFIDPPSEPITLPENFSNYSAKIVVLRAVSNIPDKPDLIFELITGRTEQTNNKKTFVFSQNDDEVSISLGKPLDFETTTDYTLTMSVKNNYDLVTEHVIKIKVTDVNDNIPYFTEVTTGSIPENEPPGTPVMQVRAFDADGTSKNNIVTFSLADNTDIFEIDPNTGNITAKITFDREEKDFYNVKVTATDNSESSLLPGKPNEGHQVFRIEITDKNDHPPEFQQRQYTADKLPEDANENFLVIEVTAVDVDTASNIEYTIVSGNEGNAFKIESSTGKITVNSKLDYENITEYSLRIRAFDGIYEDYATVTIKIEDINDNPPVFADKYSKTINEEEIVDGCILNIEAYDPDIKDRTAPQNIKFSIVKVEQQSLLSIDNEGCLRQIQPLDRDEPNGFKKWQIIIGAVDENGNGLRSVDEVEITLIDINDNAPFLTNKMPVVWDENQAPGNIVVLTAKDYDEDVNGPPFTFEIDAHASIEIHELFNVQENVLEAKAIFDREERKEYFIPIRISDSGIPTMSNVSILHLIIGDLNDNAMKEGSSKIFVYNYRGESPDTEIGRVYVDDPDDWDLPDKTFKWSGPGSPQFFSLNEENGMIQMLHGASEGEYRLDFVVTEEGRTIPKHEVRAEVIVTVKEIPEEAVDKSGSIRLQNITGEDFVSTQRYDQSIKDRFRDMLAELLNVTKENVDVFTVLQHSGESHVDVRFSAHGSPYYEPERLNGVVGQNQQKIEEQLGLEIQMVTIDECLIEQTVCEASCTTVLYKSDTPLLIYTNTSSFVGVNAFTRAECVCQKQSEVVCLNGGTPFGERCECPDGFEGPQCQILAVGFTGRSYALYPPVSACDNTNISMEVSPRTENGLIMYIGPMLYNSRIPVQDFLALELLDGFLILTVDYGSGTIRMTHKYTKLKTDKSYTIDIVLQKKSIEMTVDNCRLSTCMSLEAPLGPNEFLNVNSPLQLGGTTVNMDMLASKYGWQYTPQTQGYLGCIRNLTINDKTYNLGQPSLFKNVDINCQHTIPVAVAFGIDSNFLIAIFVCLAVLLILILAVVVHKKHHDGWHEKDTDDIRETIINYEDEGGGERDTDYDLNVFPVYEDKPYKEERLQRELNEVPDIGGFLVDKKDTCDKDNDAHPIDDCRYYAYEGDGNSSGSLSSLASCTDDGDLKFDYLSNFGPRFRKLADMYGEEPSDSDSNGDADEGWRI